MNALVAGQSRNTNYLAVVIDNFRNIANGQQASIDRPVKIAQVMDRSVPIPEHSVWCCGESGKYRVRA